MVELDIVIVNWNAGEQLKNCLESIRTASQCGFRLNRLVIVDNASSDNSLDEIASFGLILPIYIIRNSRNEGFAVACNQGAKDSKSDYLLFLNPDTILFDTSLSTSLTFLGKPENSLIGVLGIQLTGDNGKPSPTCARFPKPLMFLSKMLGFDRISARLFPSHIMTEWDHCENKYVDHVIGAFYLVRRTLFEELCGFDERFFVYLEDLDFSLRTYKAGWLCFYLAETNAYHKGGGISEQVKSTRLYYSLYSRILYGYKHFNFVSATLLMTGTVLIEPCIRVAYSLAKGSLAQINETISGYILLWKSIPKIFMQERK